jgi:hypothetical protein
MEFTETTHWVKSLYPNATDKIFYGKPTKRYFCPYCQKERRKVVLAFERVDLKKDIIKRYEFTQPLCQNCFEFTQYREIMNAFYGTNIY